MTLFRMQEWITMRAIRKSKKKNRKKRTMEKRKKGGEGRAHTHRPPPPLSRRMLALCESFAQARGEFPMDSQGD